MLVTSMTEVGDEIFWRQLLKVGDGFKLYALSLNTSQAYLDLEDVTNSHQRQCNRPCRMVHALSKSLQFHA